MIEKRTSQQTRNKREPLQPNEEHPQKDLQLTPYLMVKD